MYFYTSDRTQWIRWKVSPFHFQTNHQNKVYCLSFCCCNRYILLYNCIIFIILFYNGKQNPQASACWIMQTHSSYTYTYTYGSRLRRRQLCLYIFRFWLHFSADYSGLQLKSLIAVVDCGWLVWMITQNIHIHPVEVIQKWNLFFLPKPISWPISSGVLWL